MNYTQRGLLMVGAYLLWFASAYILCILDKLGAISDGLGAGIALGSFVVPVLCNLYHDIKTGEELRGGKGIGIG